VDVGSEGKPAYVPAELCDILPGTAFADKLDGTETSKMINYACKPPAENAKAIVNQGLQQLGLNPAAAGGILEEFGITVSNQFATVPGRLLPPPSIFYGAGKQIGVNEGESIIGLLNR
jgi:eukaryotic translation initiation factor 2C